MAQGARYEIMPNSGEVNLWVQFLLLENKHRSPQLPCDSHVRVLSFDSHFVSEELKTEIESEI